MVYWGRKPRSVGSANVFAACGIYSFGSRQPASMPSSGSSHPSGGFEPRASILPDGPDTPHHISGGATLEFEQGLFDCTSSCAAVGNFQPNSLTAMTAWVRFDTFSALSIAVT